MKVLSVQTYSGTSHILAQPITNRLLVKTRIASVTTGAAPGAGRATSCRQLRRSLQAYFNAHNEEPLPEWLVLSSMCTAVTQAGRSAVASKFVVYSHNSTWHRAIVHHRILHTGTEGSSLSASEAGAAATPVLRRA